jgi:prepilin-type N-terminal cleavage/methylation domain-containing protein
MRRRSAFTLVELLVAMALVVFIMAILSEAFVVGLKTFRDLKSIGDMNERLRSVTTVLRDDLSADHFEGRRRLSDRNFWITGPPREGFVHLVHPAAPVNTPPYVYYQEGADADGIPSYVATNHVLHFTVKRRANRKDRFFAASVPPVSWPLKSPLLTLSTGFRGTLTPGGPTTVSDDELDARFQLKDMTTSPPTPLPPYKSQWGEVAYYLVPTGDTAGGVPGGTFLYALYRVEFAVTADNSNVNYPVPGPAPDATYGVPVQAGPSPSFPQLQLALQQGYYQNVSWQPVPDQTNYNLYFNNPSDLTNPSKRSFNVANPGARLTQLGPSVVIPQAPTLMMTDVLSFQVEALSPQGTPQPTVANPNPAPGSDFLDGQAIDFDTGAAGTPPVNINALKITLRVWDAKTQQARQISILQDM